MIFVQNRQTATKRNRSYAAKQFDRFWAKRALSGPRSYFARGLKNTLPDLRKIVRSQSKSARVGNGGLKESYPKIHRPVRPSVCQNDGQVLPGLPVGETGGSERQAGRRQTATSRDELVWG